MICTTAVRISEKQC